MFDRICVRTDCWSAPKAPIDLGFLAEALLYYGRVELVMTPANLGTLVRAIGPEEILELMKQGHLGVTYQAVRTGICTYGNTNLHNVVQIAAPHQALQNAAPEAFKEALGKVGRGTRLGNRFAAAAAQTSEDEALREAMTNDLREPSFIRNAVKRFLSVAAPWTRLPSDLRFTVTELPDGRFLVDSNLDYASITSDWRRHRPIDHDLEISSSWLLGQIVEVRENLNWSSRFESEIALDVASSSLIGLKLDTLVARRDHSARQLSLFHEHALRGRSVGEAIRSGKRSFRDLLALLDAARRFKDWIRKAEESEGRQLLAEYIADVSNVGWAERLPAKSLRFLLFTGLGLGVDALVGGVAGTMTGAVLGATDTFLLDKIIGGWKPSQFVNGPLQDFLQSQTGADPAAKAG